MMVNRTFVVGFVAVLSIGSMSARTEASALGGFRAGRSFSIQDGFHRSGGPHFAVSSGAHIHAPGIAARRLRRTLGFGVPLVGAGVYYGTYDNPVEEVKESEKSAGTPATDNTAPVLKRVDQGGLQGCRAQTRMVPSEDGSERQVTIWRC
jgi:hypothetical protein